MKVSALATPTIAAPDASPVEGLDAAKAAAERDRLVDRIMDGLSSRFGGRSIADTIYGDPVERDGVTVITVARVRSAAARCECRYCTGHRARDRSVAGCRRTRRPARR